MTLNIEILRQAIEWAEEEADKGRAGQWNQAKWATADPATFSEEEVTDLNWAPASAYVSSCGSSFCLAGHICVAAGDRLLVGDIYGRGMSVVYVVDGEGKVHGIAKRARDLLGVDSVVVRHDPSIDPHYYIQSDLFHGGHSIDDLRFYAGRLAAHHGHTL